MTLTILGSGSAGNGYVLQSDTEALVIECGMPIEGTLIALGFDVRKVAACIVSHQHGDHAAHIEQYMERMTVYCSSGTSAAINYRRARRPSIIEAKRPFSAGRFTILPFDTQHDCVEPLGFLINHPEIGTLLFATDTYYLKYRFEGLNTILLECNYAEDILNENIESGSIPPNVRNRTLQSHMSLRTTKQTLKSNDLTDVSNIILIHLSSQNSDPERFRREVELATGKRVTIATKNTKLTIGKIPF